MLPLSEINRFIGNLRVLTPFPGLGNILRAHRPQPAPVRSLGTTTYKIKHPIYNTPGFSTRKGLH